MAKIEKSINDVYRLTVSFHLEKSDFDQLEAFRKGSEKRLQNSVPFPEIEEYTFDNAIRYIVSEVLSGRARYIDLEHAFSD